jgi:hypothetical protein
MNGIGIGTMTPLMVDWMLSQRRGQSCTNEPQLNITCLDPSKTYRTARTTIDLAGLAGALGNAVTNVSWTNYANGARGVAAGTNTWFAAGIPLQLSRTNVIAVVGTTTSWASAYGGNTTFNGTVRVACYPIRATLVWQGTNALLNWTGGGPPYSVQWATSLQTPEWADFLPDATPPVNLPSDLPIGFYRVVGR